MKATYTIIFDREDDGRVIASVVGVPGCHAYGATTTEALRKVKTTLRYYLECLLREGKKPPLPRKPITVDINLAV